MINFILPAAAISIAAMLAGNIDPATATATERKDVEAVRIYGSSGIAVIEYMRYGGEGSVVCAAYDALGKPLAVGVDGLNANFVMLQDFEASTAHSIYCWLK